MGLLTKARRGISQFPRKECLHMPGSATTPDPLDTSCDASNGLAFRLRNDVGVREIIFSRLDGWPAHSPTDASLRPSRAAAHGSGPMRIATPSSYRTHQLLSAGLPAHCEKLWTLPDTAVFTGADMDQPRNLAKLVTME